MKCLTTIVAMASGAKNYGFEKFYPEKRLTTEEYSDRLDKWMRLMKEITRK